jgi:ferredoxin/flavodoxin---NADP+ reductase
MGSITQRPGSKSAAAGDGMGDAGPARVGPAPPSTTRWTRQQVVSVRRWTPTLLTFRTTRDAAFRFTPGHYARLGLPAEGETLWRPFSMASAPDDKELEFLAVRVEDGAFSAHLAQLSPGDPILIDQAVYGFLILGQLEPGQDLWLVASGTGLGPFLSILRDGSAWSRFRRIVVVHSVRRADELAYREELLALAARSPGAQARLDYVPVVTRESVPGALERRVPALLQDGVLERSVDLALDVAESRVMVCGNPELLADMRRLLTERGFRTSRRGAPGQMAFENYW